MPRQKAAHQAAIVAALCMLAVGMTGPVGAAESAPTADIVGEVLTAIGNGRILSGASQAQAAARGVRVRAGDRVETAVGGHVHIRFVDGGLVSVRPLSRLHIEDYRSGDAQRSAAIKFHLEEGVMRSVTGAWGEAQRDRFRLNTPIAAIGIKGTDFIVKADQSSTLASVATGAIVMAPLEGACAQSLGPCSGQNALQLSAEMPGMMLEMQRQNGVASPRLVPAVDLLARAGSGVAPFIGKKGSVQFGSASVPVGEVSTATQAADSTLPYAHKQLVWLHNSSGWNVPANSISQRYEDALAAGRTPMVGNLFITLYRDETHLPVFQPIGTAAAFNLAAASATYTPWMSRSPGESVAISGATLDVDFAKSNFATRMDLASPSLGRAEFAASGTIAANGGLLGQQTGQSLAGALSNDGREAGYHFSKLLPAGAVSGITLWGR